MKLSTVLLCAVAALAGAGAVCSASAQSSQQIMDNLLQQTQPAPGVAPAAAADGAAPQTKVFETVPSAGDLLDALLPSPQTKDLMVIPRNQQKPVGLLITFDYDSDRITPSGRDYLDRLAVVLRDPRMQPYNIALIGHTDAAGDAGYNLDLSRRRARSALGYLVANYNINPAAMIVDGVGKYELVVPSDPYHRNNRSVVVAAVGRR
ncbi:OmpA family protein [Azospirillum sp. TSO35-2]|uniref:OmpA family protein n=1 Tax=Azospirillum sp. TSO35-2 TaxID=716796 RepID=UPI0013049BA5|nr:OmpA family protein [Azospirillum sp. TSO35-2]